MKVAVVMGSKSDYLVIEKVEGILTQFNVGITTRVISAHRTPYVAEYFAKNAEAEGIEVIIAAAGKAAHLAGVIAAYTTVPVIGLPIKSSLMDGLDSLLSMVQMPTGIPVATVGVNGGENAGLLAIEILSVKYEPLRVALKKYRKAMAEAVIKDDESFNQEV